MSAAISVLIAEDDKGHAFGDMVRRLAEFLVIVEMPQETPLDRPPHAR